MPSSSRKEAERRRSRLAKTLCWCRRWLRKRSSPCYAGNIAVQRRQDTTEGSILHRPTEHLKCNQEIPLTDNLWIPFKTNNNPSAELIPTLSLILSHSMILFIFILIRITKWILNETTRPTTNEATTRDGSKLKCKIMIKMMLKTDYYLKKWDPELKHCSSWGWRQWWGWKLHRWDSQFSPERQILDFKLGQHLFNWLPW